MLRRQIEEQGFGIEDQAGEYKIKRL